MNLTRSLVETEAAAYRRQEPLYAVEREQIETLGTAFEEGEFGWRDAEWPVRWYYRRFLGDVPHDERRYREERFARNDFEAVRDAVTDAAAAADAATRLERLTDLEGVDVPVASAFLFFFDPDASVVVGEREWTVLEDAGVLAAPYPDPPSIGEYERYLEGCRTLAERFDCDMWTLYRALWRLWKEEYG